MQHQLTLLNSLLLLPSTDDGWIFEKKYTRKLKKKKLRIKYMSKFTINQYQSCFSLFCLVLNKDYISHKKILFRGNVNKKNKIGEFEFFVLMKYILDLIFSINYIEYTILQ